MERLKIYGIARSRAFRTLWMAHELGLAYDHVPVDFATGAVRAPDYLALNPNGHVPTIDDDGFVLWESMAINLYLAKKHGAKKHGAGGLYPAALADEARAWQWSFWGMTEIERPLLTMLRNSPGHPENQHDAEAAAAAQRQLAGPLAVLDRAVAPGPYLLGEAFTVADLNVAGILTWARPAALDLSAVPDAARWLKNCLDRPAARAVRQLQR